MAITPFNFVDTIAILMCKQISSNSSKMKLSANTYHVYLFKCVQTNDWC